MKRYHSKRRVHGTRVIQFAIFLMASSTIGLIALYSFSPGPFKREFFERFLGKKIALPLSRTLLMRPLDPTETKLPKLELTINESLWAKIEKNPLKYGRKWENAYLNYKDELNLPVTFKIRGGQTFSTYHWGGIKKSLWIKTKAGIKIDSGKRFTLTNFKNPIYSADALGYDWGKEIGLLTPEHQFLNVFLNKRRMGVFHKVDYFDKYWVQKSERTSGDVYSLDDATSLVDTFTKAQFWEKKSKNRKKDKTDRENINKLISCLKNPECKTLKNIVSIDKFLAHNILFELLNSPHSDNFHNQRIYHDPSNGKFEPIVWDIWPQEPERKYNQSYHILDQQILLKPELRFRKLKLQYKYLTQKLTPIKMNQDFNRYRELMKFDLRADRYLGGNIPFSYNDWLKSWLKYENLLIKRRNEMLSFSNSPGSIKLIQNGKKYSISSLKQAHLTITDINTAKGQLRKVNGKKLPLTLIEAWSGFRDQRASGIEGKSDKVWYRLRQSPLVLHFNSKNKILSIGLKNRITGKKHRITPVKGEFPNQLVNHSIVPRKKEKRIVTFKAGKHLVKKNRFYNKDTVLRFLPGAKIIIYPGVSIHSEGKVFAEGTKKRPVIFRGKKSNQYWGAFSISGKHGNGSHFKHVRFSGGKDAILKSVFYSGMVNCYHAQCDFDQCYFTNNKGDDALNVKSSNTQITNSIFYKTAFDAIDLDFTDGIVKDNLIYKTGNDGIDLGTGHAHVINNIIYKAGDKGISSGERSFPLVTGNILEKNKIGVAIKDESEVLMISNHFKENTTAVSAYQKKTEFNGSHPVMINNLLEKNKTLIEKDPQSRLSAFGNIDGENFIQGFSSIQERPSDEWISKLHLISNRKRDPLGQLIEKYNGKVAFNLYPQLLETMRNDK